MSKARSNKVCDDCGNALTLLPGFLVRCDAYAKSRQGIAWNKVEGQDTKNVARNRFGRTIVSPCVETNEIRGLQEVVWVFWATLEGWKHACEHLEPQIFLVA
jgi:hypothetical protein